MAWFSALRRKYRRRQRTASDKPVRIPRVELLESRSLLTTTLSAAATASISDAGRDGTADVLTVDSTLVRQAGIPLSVEDRAIIEFDLQTLAEAVDLAVLDFRLAGNIASGGVFGESYREFDLVAYSGDGSVTLADFDRPAALVQHVGFWADQGGRDFRLDVTQDLRDAVSAGYTHWGLRFDASVDIGPNQVFDLRLTVNGAPALTGQRGLETVPNAIRADGVEAFRVEVDLHGEVRAAVLELAGNPFLTPASGTMPLRDDGQEGDRLAGDFVYTSGEFRFDASRPFPTPFYKDNTDSPPGLAITDVGLIKITELDGQVTEFFDHAQVALVHPDLPTAAVQTLSPDVVVSDHVINVRTEGLNTQRTLRGPEIIPERITQVIYQHLPDEFDFFNLFSTQNVEQLPRLSGPNFVAGRHVTVQSDATGIGLAPFDNSANMGSQGRLLGINLLDAYDRGIWSANATHELVHQWSVYLSTGLGISDGGGHFHFNTSVGSLVGGQQWLPNGDGSFTINYEEGRNGATHASPLDLYLMGLADASEVPPIQVFSPTVQPPKSPSNPVVAPGEIIRTTTIDDIIVQHGVRSPGPESAQRDFRIGFVAESDHRLLTPSEMTFYEILAAHYTKPLPADEPAPYVGDGWSSIAAFFGAGTTWSSLVPGRSETPNQPPVAQGGVYTVLEDAAQGALITTVQATDEDSGQKLVFGIRDNRDKIFLIDSATGRLTLNKALDREIRGEYVLNVVVADTGLPSQADTVTITIQVGDVNEFPPSILPGQTFMVAENAASATVLGDVLGTDADAEAILQNFAIVAGNADGAFAIDAATGALRIADGAKLDYENAPLRTLQITVSDGLRTSVAESISIQVTDANDAPAIANQTFSIQENTPTGASVGAVAAADADVGQTLTYAILSGNADNAFALNPSTGHLTVSNASALDYETNPTFTLSVRVTDNGNPALSTTAIVTVQLLDEIEILIDIDPGDATNTINTRSEKQIAVAILSSPTFNALTQVNASSLTFGKTGSENSLARNKKTGKPITESRDVNGDGILDLVVFFDTSKTGLTVDSTQATLKGSLSSGALFQLTGPVRILTRR